MNKFCRFLTILLMIAYAECALSVKDERVTVSKRIENSTFLGIVEFAVIEPLEGKDEHYFEKSFGKVIHASIDSKNGSDISFYHVGTIREEETLCCKIGKRYLLFLKKYKDGYESSSGRFGAYEIIEDVPLFVDDHRMKIGLDYAEQLIFLHKLYLKQ